MKRNRIINVFLIIIVAVSLFLGHAQAGVILDKKGREITLEWAETLTENDQKTVHPGYASQRSHYEKIKKDFDVFFDEYNGEMADELKTEKHLSLASPRRLYHLLRVKEKEESCGFAYFKKTDEEGHSWYLEFIVLLPSYQQSGIGTHLVFGIKEKFPDLKRLSLDTRDFNVNAHGAYESLGFVKQKAKKEGYFHYVWEQE
jgi:ribosomal protein S18 acetylase RimI-like enzyme